jgi:[acyl-carrier-protein] S-malonyltransferase
MAPGARRLEATLAGVEVKRPSFPVWSNVTGAATDDPDEIRRNLIAQVTSPVRFLACVQAARAAGMSKTIEPAPGVVLSGLISRIDPAIETVSVPDAESLASMAAWSPS